MNKTRFALKAFAGTLTATVLVLGSLSAPAEAAKRDTGWGSSSYDRTFTAAKRDTGWG